MGLGDMWHKTLVYFGMADEDDEYYDEQTLTPQDVRESGLPDRAATVRRVDRGVPERMPADRGVSQRSSRSSRRRGVDFDDIFSEEDAFRSQRSAVVRPLPTPVERTPVKVHLVEPKNFNDAQLIADKFKGDIPV
ncbi:MAG: hypothetical protein GX536_00410, partial [Actinobacteria bacterium]|nr:hypothetical protein [Actinomycetota bacterium]